MSSDEHFGIHKVRQSEIIVGTQTRIPGGFGAKRMTKVVELNRMASVTIQKRNLFLELAQGHFVVYHFLCSTSNRKRSLKTENGSKNT